MQLTVVETESGGSEPISEPIKFAEPINIAEPINTEKVRRALDLVLVMVAAPLWIPILAILGAGVAFTSGLPVFFTQVRTGKHGKPFTMFKFRSMTSGSETLIPSRDHITKFGQVLRRTSLDELPQLINVLRGDMSLVGPRPMLPVQSDELDDGQRTRHLVLPGMTGLAQVNGRNAITWSERIKFDQQWVERPTVRSYLKILRRTFAAIQDSTGTTGHSASDPIAEPSAQKAA